jgi:preprotein translocase subunit SecG
MTALIITIHVIVSIALILIVLLQTGKGADMGAVFGGAGSQALFGNTGAATFLGKMTTAAAVIFMLTSLTLAYISKSGSKSVVADIKPATQQTQPALPVAQPDPLPETREADTASPELQQIPVTNDTATTMPAESVDESDPIPAETPATETPVTAE